MQFNDIIEMLLKKREENDREHAERSAKINDLLTLAGYDMVAAVDEVADAMTEQIIEERLNHTQPEAEETAPKQIVY